MRIYCDIDDVLSETARTLCALVARMFGVTCAYEDVRGFDLQDVFGLSDEQYRALMATAHETDFLLSYPVVEGAVEGVRALAAAGHEVDFVTGRPASSHVGTSAWLARAGLGGFSVTYVDKYGRDFPHADGEPETISFDALANRRYDVAIDDSPVALKLLAGWPQTRVFVFDRPWNRDFALAPNMTRLASWSCLSVSASPRP